MLAKGPGRLIISPCHKGTDFFKPFFGGGVFICKHGFSDPKFARLLDCLWCTMLTLCTVFARRYYRLCHIPGSFIASFTKFRRVFIQSYGDFPDRLVALHDNYGPLVRVGPKTIRVSDPGSLSTVYSSHGEFSKGEKSLQCSWALNNHSRPTHMNHSEFL
jgi:hypothetical protein